MSGKGAGTSAAAMAKCRRGHALATILALALLLLPSACGRRKLVPTQPGTETLPPEIKAVSPGPHTQVILGEPIEISVEFTTPLDSSSVSTRTVFLMIDTARQPIDVVLSPNGRQIIVRPLQPLLLGAAYTVELSPNLRSAEGVLLGKKYSWQFDVNSLRHPSTPNPPDRATGVSPFTMIWWAVNFGAEIDATSCQVFAGRDSAAVAAHSMPPIYNGSPWSWLPRMRWPQDGQPVFWTVMATNSVTGDRTTGPVWRFTPVLPTARVDSLFVTADFSDYSYSYTNALCNDPRIVIGPGYMAGVVWNFWWSIPSVKRARWRMAGVRMALYAAPGDEATLDSSSVTLWPTTASWTCAAIRSVGPPRLDETDGPLADGVHVLPGQVRFESAALAAHLEASIRYLEWIDLYGYVFKADRVVHCVSPQTNDNFSRLLYLKLYYYP